MPCINDLEASYRFKMNCESSDAILQTYMGPAESPEAVTEASEGEEEIITEAESEGEPEAEMPVDESDLYNYQSQMYDENGDMICEEDNLENALVSNFKLKVSSFHFLLIFQDDMKTNDLLDEKPPKPERKKESSKAKAARIKKNQAEKSQGLLDQQKIHTCEICGNSYKYRHALEVHMRR